ncbi:hypothetical protein ACOME3_003113 [Neoechinorhynchus agilis]
MLAEHSSERINQRSSASFLINAYELWDRGFLGQGVRISVIDSGFCRYIGDNVEFIQDFPQMFSGTHGCRINEILGIPRKCFGLCPMATLYLHNVFSSNKTIETELVVTALRTSMKLNVDIINLSFGGSDYLDEELTNQLNAAASNGIVIVSAVGNDGPSLGTIKSPADHPLVIGVGAFNSSSGDIAMFSSRGMTTRELAYGSGRMKPDILAPGIQVDGDCLSRHHFSTGTSVSAAIITGAIALLMSAQRILKPELFVSNGGFKHILTSTCDKINNRSIMEQGCGVLNLTRAFNYLLYEYEANIWISPGTIDMTNCPLMFPYCSQPLFLGSSPLMANLTIINGYGSYGFQQSQVRLVSDLKVVDVDIEVSFSTISVKINVRENVSAIIKDRVNLNITDQQGVCRELSIPLRLWIIQSPPRSKRILWDQYHSITYPYAYCPTDRLFPNVFEYDELGDHLYTNFNQLYTILVKRGYYVDVLYELVSSVKLANYGVYMILDSERWFTSAEIDYISENSTAVLRESIGLPIHRHGSF